MYNPEDIELGRDAIRLAITSEVLAGKKVARPRLDRNPYKGKFALDPKGMEIFRGKIKDGKIDMGPRADHSKPVKDIRDNSDPETIGMSIIARHNGG